MEWQHGASERMSRARASLSAQVTCCHFEKTVSLSVIPYSLSQSPRRDMQPVYKWDTAQGDVSSLLLIKPFGFLLKIGFRKRVFLRCKEEELEER